MVQQIIPFNETQITCQDYYNARLVITGNCTLNYRLELKPGCTIEFRGGIIIGTNSDAQIIGKATSIIADEYQIFQNVKLGGTFTNETLSAHWFGANCSV